MLRRLQPKPDLSFVTVVHGWPEDTERWLHSIAAHHSGEGWEAIVVENSGDPEDAARISKQAADQVAIVIQSPATGFGEAVNTGIEAARGEVVVLFDPGVEVTGDVIAPLTGALADPSVALAGPFGLRAKGTPKEYEASAGPVVDAIEGYCMAFRRADAQAAGGFDRHFKFYRIADVEFSFRLRAARGSAVVVAAPVRKHAHRLWEATDPAERERLSRRNLYRFLDRWGERSDLLTR